LRFRRYYFCQSKLCLPGFPVTDFHRRALIIGAHSGGSVRDSHPVPLSIPAGLSGGAGPQKDVFSFVTQIRQIKKALPN
jgi:hypothetical protein